MKFVGDYHIHTYSSDGNTTINGVVKRAKGKGLKEIAITDHSFASIGLGMTLSKFAKQKKQIDSIKNFKIYHGIEANIINEQGDIDVPESVQSQCDLIIAGFHRYLKPKYIKASKNYILINGFGSLKKRQSLIDVNTKAFVNCINRGQIDVIAHLNHRALVDVKTVLKVAKEKDVYIEINESHVKCLEPYAKEIIESGVKLLVCSDAHWYPQIGKTKNISKFIEKHNIPKENVYGLNKKPEFKGKR